MNDYRNYKIDFLRGLAILAVLILHFNISYHLDQSLLNHIYAQDFIKAFASNGNYGVTMFFVVPGFLITLTTLSGVGSLVNLMCLVFTYYALQAIPKRIIF